MSDLQADSGSTAYTVSFEADAATDASVVGGKGANLARLVEAGFPVPPGFCVTTAAYRTLLTDSETRRLIESLERLDPADADRIDETSAAVRERIRHAEFPSKVRQSIERALDAVDSESFAVRSSATAEDLPAASFAGQHETFLGVDGGAVLDRIRDCFASLFTDRAVSYRSKNDVSHADIAMATVVQTMVDPDAAGVLFTADPVSGNRYVASVDANYGLGDTVVAGEISPDNARVDRRTGEVLEYEVGGKSHAVRTRDDGRGTERVEVSPAQRKSRVLSNAELRELVALGERVEELFDAPQDVEWALVDGDVYLLQSRPITSLFPLPSPAPNDDRLHVYFSFGHQQAMPEALPPLVVDWWRGLLDGAAARIRSQDAVGAVEAAHRVYVDLTPLLRIGPLRRRIATVVAAVNEPASDALQDLLARRHGSFPDRGRSANVRVMGRTIVRAAPKLASVLPGAIGRFGRAFLRTPDPEREQARLEAWGKELASRVREPDALSERVRIAFEQFDLFVLLGRVLPRIGPLLLASLVSRKVLARLFPDADAHLDALGKGFEMELVTRMNQRLGDLADVARERPEVREALRRDASLEEIQTVAGGDAFVDTLEKYLDEFGHRTSGEIDLSRPRWKDNPATLMRTIRSNLDRTEPGAHRDHLRRLERDAENAAAHLEARADRGGLGPIKKAIVRRLVRTYRGGIQLREYPKHGIAHFFTAVHEVVSDAGEALAAENRLDRPDDVWYLREDELLAALEENAPVGEKVTDRRRAHDFYASLTAPPLLTSEGEVPAATGDAERSERTLTGTAVSSGVVEGRARVIRDPSGESLENGEILVAPSTDPGWTPLFLNAAGLVMEVGGRMTHGALVAREYGIPAVVSVSSATETIRTGERIRLDGSRGTVELLDRSDESAAERDSGEGTGDGASNSSPP